MLLDKATVASHERCSIKFSMDANSPDKLVTAINEAGLCRTPSHHVKIMPSILEIGRRFVNFMTLRLSCFSSYIR
jgi:hypothetical protein